MYFAKYGSGGNVIVGLHGWSGDHTTFAPLLKYLPPAVTFYCVDLPGSGKSPPPEKWEVSSYVCQVANELARLSSNPLTLIGSCSGGLLCLFITKYLTSTDRAATIKRIVLLDPFAYLPWYFQVFVSPSMGKVGWYAYSTTFANPLGRWLTNLSLRKQRAEVTNMTGSFARVNHQATYQYLKLLAEGGPAEQFKDLLVPIDILYGENTFAAVKKSVQQWEDIFPETNCYLLKGVGHLPLEEATDRVATILFEPVPR